MFRIAAGAGLTVTLGLVTAAALAGPAAASPAAKTVPAAGASGSGLPVDTSQCAPSASPDPGSGHYAAQANPWPQQVLDLTTAHQYSNGSGVKVAVIDSGVDANSQFGNRVQPGPTLAPPQQGQASGDGDCVGHGTMVAGIIGAAPSGKTSFVGMAPGADIVSIKVTNSDQQSISLTTLQKAISQAISDHVRVISISIASTGNSASLQGTLEAARLNNIVVVAAAGNDEPAQSGQAAQKGPFYPASYPGVLSVGAVCPPDPSSQVAGACSQGGGSLASFSDRKSNAGVVAPGVDVTSTYPGSGKDTYMAEDGTSFAAPYVAGLAALIISRDPGLTSDQVVQRIEDTADGSIGPGSGHGLINPVQALTAQAPASGTGSQAASRPGAVKIDRSPPNLSEKVLALALGGGALVIAIIVIAAAVVIPAGRRRGWRSA